MQSFIQFAEHKGAKTQGMQLLAVDCNVELLVSTSRANTVHETFERHLALLFEQTLPDPGRLRSDGHVFLALRD